MSARERKKPSNVHSSSSVFSSRGTFSANISLSAHGERTQSFTWWIEMITAVQVQIPATASRGLLEETSIISMPLADASFPEPFPPPLFTPALRFRLLRARVKLAGVLSFDDDAERDEIKKTERERESSTSLSPPFFSCSRKKN